MDTVMSILDEAVVIHGADGELVFANPAAARRLGFETSEEAVATPERANPRALLDPRRGGRELGAGGAGRAPALPGEPAEPLTLRVIERETGARALDRTKARAIEGPTGEVLYSVTVIEDVTDVKRAEFAHRLLARTGELLSHSHRLPRDARAGPELLVPEFADWCAVEIARRATAIARVASAHRDPSDARARCASCASAIPVCDRQTTRRSAE